MDFGSFFASVPDPRAPNARHDLCEVLLISFAAVLCGAEGCQDMADFGEAKEPSLRKFLRLRHGIPSHDTFSRIFRLLDPVAFEAASASSWQRLLPSLVALLEWLVRSLPLTASRSPAPSRLGRERRRCISSRLGAPRTGWFWGNAGPLVAARPRGPSSWWPCLIWKTPPLRQMRFTAIAKWQKRSASAAVNMFWRSRVTAARSITRPSRCWTTSRPTQSMGRNTTMAAHRDETSGYIGCSRWMGQEVQVP